VKKSKSRQTLISSDAFTHYVALGDSISTDDYPGKGKGGVSLFYKNQNKLYPDFRNRDLRTSYPGIELKFLALDGATTTDVLNQQLPALQKISGARAIVTLTAGGNDLLSFQAGTSDIEFGLDSILATLLRDFPAGKILLGTIYDPTDGVGDLMGPGTFVGREMRILHEINDHIRSLSSVPQIEVVDIYQHFLGHGSPS
jgi:lysophospholipase L1-like esterase